MDTYMHKTMVSVVSLEKIGIIRSQEFMASKARLKLLKKMIILGPKTAILGPQFCRILVLGPHFWWSGGTWAPRAPLDLPLNRLTSLPLTMTMFHIYTCIMSTCTVIQQPTRKPKSFWHSCQHGSTPFELNPLKSL